MATPLAEETRRFTPAELVAMRDCGVIGSAESVELRHGRLTVDRRLRPIMPSEAILLVETGIVEERVELVDGELRIVSPQSEAHAWVVRELTELLANAYRGVAKVGVQLPAGVLGPSLPEPDFAVSRPLLGVRHACADDLVLVVEVTVTSHARDRRKAELYAEAGVPELWLIDVDGRAVTVCAEPRSDGPWGSGRRLGEECSPCPRAPPRSACARYSHRGSPALVAPRRPLPLPT